MYPLFQFFSQIGNGTVFSTIFWPCIVSNLSVVSNPFRNRKSSGCFNIFLAFHCRQSLRRLYSFDKWKISLLFQQFFGLRLQAIYLLFEFFSQLGNRTGVLTIFWNCIERNLSVVSILLSNRKSNRCFNTFMALHCRQSLRCVNSFLKCKI